MKDSEVWLLLYGYLVAHTMDEERTPGLCSLFNTFRNWGIVDSDQLRRMRSQLYRRFRQRASGYMWKMYATPPRRAACLHLALTVRT